MRPPSDPVRSTVHDRLSPLRGEHRDVLLRAAAIGREFDVDVLAELSRTSAARVRAALRAASRLQLVERVEGAAPRYRFRHALTRDAVYGELVASQLQPLHREIAFAIERLAARRRPELEELAYHWWAAGDAIRGARYNEEAGDRAAALHAHDQAVRAYRRALDVLPERSAVRARLERKIADIAAASATVSFARQPDDGA